MIIMNNVVCLDYKAIDEQNQDKLFLIQDLKKKIQVKDIWLLSQ